MTPVRDLRDGARIARAELRRSVRDYLGDARRIVGVVFAAVLFGGALLVSLPIVFLAGRAVERLGAVPGFGAVATVLPVGLLALAALRTLERIGRIEAADFVLVAVHPRAVVLGLIGAEAGRLALWFALPATAVVAVFAAGLGAPTLPVTVALVFLPLAACAAVWGYALGLGLVRVSRRLPGVRRLLKPVGLLAVVVLLVVSQSVGRYLVDTGAVAPLLAGVAVGPAEDYAALAFVGTPLARPVGAAAAVTAALVALVPVGLWVATRQATALWFTDAPRSAERTETSAGGFAPPPPFAWTDAGHVAWGLLVRGVRQPQEFSHLLVVLFVLGPVGSTVVESGGDGLGPVVAGTGALLGVYLAGAAFGLNPLGDDRPQLPLLLLARVTPRTLVRGRIVAGLTVGLPVIALGAVGGVALGAAPARALALGAVGAALAVAAAAFAVGLGASYPVYEEREVWGTETVVPSTLVIAVYSAVVGGGTVAGLVAAWFVAVGAVGTTPLALGGAAAYVLVTAGPSYGSYRYGVGRYRTYEVD